MQLQPVSSLTKAAQPFSHYFSANSLTIKNVGLHQNNGVAMIVLSTMPIGGQSFVIAHIPEH